MSVSPGLTCNEHFTLRWLDITYLVTSSESRVRRSYIATHGHASCTPALLLKRKYIIKVIILCQSKSTAETLIVELRW